MAPSSYLGWRTEVSGGESMDSEAHVVVTHDGHVPLGYGDAGLGQPFQNIPRAIKSLAHITAEGRWAPMTKEPPTASRPGRR